MDYELYHDESMVKGYWHGMLLVPIAQKQNLLDLLAKARSNTKYDHPLSLKGIRKETGRMYDCADAWMSIAIAAMISRIRLNFIQPIYLGERTENHKLYSVFNQLIKTKLILFRERDNLTSMNYVTDFGSKVEITFRIGLKGGIHWLGSDDEYIGIQKIHFDGHEHYRRNIDQYRIIGRLNGLRDYCHISNSQDSIDDRPGNHEAQVHQDYEDCQLIQLTDLLVSSFRSILSNTTNSHHRNLVAPARDIIRRQLQGYARMLQSRWYNSIWMSQVYLENNQWKFEPLGIERDEKVTQPPLPFLEPHIS